MNLDELQSVQSRERQATSLQNLRSSFYQEAGEFIQQLIRERDRTAERADDPFASPEVRRLTDDVETAKSTVEAIYERRVGKVVKMASIAAADMPTDDEGLTAEERELFDTLVAEIEANRAHVLDEVLEGEGSDLSCARGAGRDGSTADANEPTEQTPDAAASAAEELGIDPTPDEGVNAPVDAADMMGSGDEAPDSARDGPESPPTDTAAATPGADDASADATPADPTPAESAAAADRTEVPPDAPPEALDAGGSTADSRPDDRDDGRDDGRGDESGANDGTDVERTTVQVLQDVGEIFGVDERTYDLSSDEVVTLPAANAEPLVEREAAERLE
ncbi:hypothetical protein [Halorarius halobius]|uniref:hypothetical protein n=1 Tax=Halorarius halobius TaxID=2962671 RepID=UPI0020CB9792|nr:hypothetical protein [Halorarius halobius]